MNAWTHKFSYVLNTFYMAHNPAQEGHCTFRDVNAYAKDTNRRRSYTSSVTNAACMTIHGQKYLYVHPSKTGQLAI